MYTYGIENITCQELDHNRIIKYLDNCGYSNEVLLKMFSESDLDTSNKYDFNCTIRNIVKKKNIQLFDVLVYIEKNFVDANRVWNSILDNKNKEILKKEVSQKYHIKTPECSLMDMFQ